MISLTWDVKQQQMNKRPKKFIDPDNSVVDTRENGVGR